MMMIHKALPLAFSSLLLFACTPGGGDPDHGPEAEACEHLEEGPAESVTAGADFSSAPDIREEHTRFDVTLIDQGGQNGGSVTYAAAKAGDYLFFLSENVPVAFYDSDGNEVAIEATEEGSEVCDLIAKSHLVKLAVGTFEVRFGPTDVSEVRLVVEMAGEHGEHEHE